MGHKALVGAQTFQTNKQTNRFPNTSVKGHCKLKSISVHAMGFFILATNAIRFLDTFKITAYVKLLCDNVRCLKSEVLRESVSGARSAFPESHLFCSYAEKTIGQKNDQNTANFDKMASFRFIVCDPGCRMSATLLQIVFVFFVKSHSRSYQWH